jgi:NADH-ubiquinone oxidoreductase chain 5
MAGLRAMGEVDMKKVVALSTLSQLGLIFMTLGLGLPTLAFFHLAAHAYFKAIIFMCAGGVIHSMKEYQDLRVLGGASSTLPVSSGVFLVANLRLCGIPFMSGFFSKDLILELLIMRSANTAVFGLALVATLLTVIYSLRITSAIFMGNTRSEAGLRILESDHTIISRLLILLGPSIVGGLGISWMVGSHRYLIFLPLWLKIRILVIILSASALGGNWGRRGKFVAREFLFNMWFMPFLFRGTLTRRALVSGKALRFLGEGGWGLVLGPKAFLRVSGWAANYLFFSFRARFLKRLAFMVGMALVVL